jgi:purine-binding chemotaxis protein CheW
VEKLREKTPENEYAEDPVLQYLTFQLSGETYAIDILHVREIIEYGSITPIPMMPDFIAGVINLRGSVVPVVDLNCRFGEPRAQITKRTSIIVIELRKDDFQLDIGVVVDLVNDVLEIRKSDIEPAPKFGAKIRTDFIEGMGKVDGSFLILLRVDNVLDVDELSVVEALASETDPPPEASR